MSLALLGLAAAWILCSVATALVVARGIRLAEREARPGSGRGDIDPLTTAAQQRFGTTLPQG